MTKLYESLLLHEMVTCALACAFYLTPQFFESKALGSLLGESISAEHLNDHALSKALDEIG